MNKNGHKSTKKGYGVLSAVADIGKAAILCLEAALFIYLCSLGMLMFG